MKGLKTNCDEFNNLMKRKTNIMTSETVYLVFKNDLQCETKLMAVFSSNMKAWKYIEELEELNENKNITYERQIWVVDGVLEEV